MALKSTSLTQPTVSPLIHYCGREALETVDYYTALNSADGHTEAWRILPRRFGESGIIAHKYLANVTDSPAIKQNDTENLIKLTETMKACELILSQLNHNSELDIRSTLDAIISRFPGPLQHKWFDQASNLFRMVREPRFSDLSWFEQDKVDPVAVKSMYPSNLQTDLTVLTANRSQVKAQ
ncbi:Nek6 NIMA kinase 6 [Fasciola gigantica]|uniref:Nek6 NIMA kinase 6 n=1 Tax=Fasciola gigantica TaxID=46835 RepID=A0A504Y9U1_FASGI|nr:Nek6 NIMA kinase 6 [Fasciola gigantica]